MSNHFSLDQACAQGALAPQDWTQQLLAMVEDCAVDNRDLLAVCQMASRGLDARGREQWMDHLIEFSLWETGSQPERLALCDHLVRSGLARVSSPARWSSFGGLVHIACEAGSIDALQWALEREPGAVRRPGGLLGIGPFHALAMRGDRSMAQAAAPLLVAAGADPDARSRDGRSALFRACGNAPLVEFLLGAGSDPMALDTQGFCALGYWLELGDWDSAALALHGADPDAFLPWGSAQPRSLDAPRLDRPLFIAACSPALSHDWGAAPRQACVAGLAALGADPLALDARGKTLWERSNLFQALSLMERASLASHCPPVGSSASKAL
jgi:ankyrin repeat protein